MSLKFPHAGFLALAAAATVAAVGASTAQAAQTSTINYRCKFPVIGTQPVTLQTSFDIPATWPVGVPTLPREGTAKVLFRQEVGAFAGLRTLGSVSDAQKPGRGSAIRARVNLTGSTSFNIRVPLELAPLTVTSPPPSEIALEGGASLPSLTLDVEGPAFISDTGINLNLYALGADGTPVPALRTPPIDVDGDPVFDSDGDPNTFDVPCALDLVGNVFLARFDLVGPELPPSNEPPSAPQTPLPSDYTELDFRCEAINLKWRPATDDSAVKEYRIDYEGAPAGGVIVPAGANSGVFSKLITGLGADSEYIFTVTAIDFEGVEGEPLEQTHYTLMAMHSGSGGCGGPVPVQPPASVTGTSTETSVTLSWTASTDPEGGPLTYQVYSGGTKVAETTGLTAQINGLSPNTDYTYTVVAVEAGGLPSLPSAAFKVKTKPDTTAPSNPIVSGISTLNSVTLSWTPATDNIGVTGYDVYLDGSATPVASVTGLTATIPGLPAGTRYTFKVVAKDAAGNRSTGAQFSLLTLPGTTPPVKYGYTLKGSTVLKTLTKGTLALNGSIAAELTLATGAISADLTLNDTSGRLTALGFLPVTAKIGFVPSGKTTGSLIDGELKTNSKVRIKVKEIKLFGAIPLAGGNSCQTRNLSDINLKSTQPEFSPLEGGPIAGTYKISDLNGCGALNGLVSPLTAGSGNTINLNLTPAG